MTGIRGRDAGVLSCGKLGAGDSETAKLSLVVLGTIIKRFLYAIVRRCCLVSVSAAQRSGYILYTVWHALNH